MAELVVASKCEFQSNAEGLDGHDGDGSDSRANGEVDERILLSVDGGNLVDHGNGERDDGNGVK